MTMTRRQALGTGRSGGDAGRRIRGLHDRDGPGRQPCGKGRPAAHIGQWHYDQSVYDNDRYTSAATLIHTLCDIVSKNDNLMLNVPMLGDGTIDDKEERIAEEIAAWMSRNGEAIYGTRPWRVHAEGSTRAGGGVFSEGGPKSPYQASDIRYVTRGDKLHALLLGWPSNGLARLTLLGSDNPIGRGTVERVTLPFNNTPLPSCAKAMRWR